MTIPKQEIEPVESLNADLYKLLWITTTDAILIIDADSVILQASPSVQKLFGYAPAELVGAPLSTLQPLRLREPHRLGMQNYRSTKKRTLNWDRTGITCLHRDGHEFHAEVNFRELVLDQKQIFAGSISDISTRVEAEEMAMRFRTAMDAAGDCMLLIDVRTMKIIDANKTASRVLGYSREELLASPLQDLHAFLSAESLQLQFDQLLVDEHGLGIAESTYRRKDGTTFPVELCRQVMRSGTSLLVVSVARDISDRHQAREAIENFNAGAAQTTQLMAAVEELTAFSYTVSHDLRAPLRAIGSFADLLLAHSCDLDPQAADYIRRIQGASAHMGDLIQGLLDLAQIGNQRLAFTSVNLSEIGRQIVSDMKRADPARSVAVVIASDMEAQGDPLLIQQAIQNLLHNAWKYTSKTLNAQIFFDSARRGNKTVYRIADNGAGFDANYAGKLFRPFERLHRASDFPGTGIGLATVKRILNRHGGSVWAESVLGAGASFYFTLPDVNSGNRPENTASTGSKRRHDDTL